jgi:hypothetical protein
MKEIIPLDLKLKTKLITERVLAEVEEALKNEKLEEDKLINANTIEHDRSPSAS